VRSDDGRGDRWARRAPTMDAYLAGDTDRRERRTELEDPGLQLRPGELFDRAILARPANRPAEDHPVPLEGLGRGALGGLRREEQIDRPAECQVPARIRCPSTRGRRIGCQRSGSPKLVVASIDRASRSSPQAGWPRSGRSTDHPSRSRPRRLQAIAADSIGAGRRSTRRPVAHVRLRSQRPRHPERRRHLRARLGPRRLPLPRGHGRS
jgi:hypothetical protein